MDGDLHELRIAIIDPPSGGKTPLKMDKLDLLLGREFLAVSDLILAEVLQGF